MEKNKMYEENLIAKDNLSQSEMPSKNVKVENNKNNNSAMHFFMYMVSFLSLALFATGIGNIIFQIINKNFTDDIGYNYAGQFSQSAVKYGIATLLIAMPIYFVTMYFINKKMYAGEIAIDSSIRKWLTYIVLFIAAATIIGDLITIVFYVLDGDLTVKFILKALTILFIAGVIFSYYVWDMRKKTTAGIDYSINKIFFLSGISISVVVLVTSFFVIDNPSVARDKKTDQRTINLVQQLDSEIKYYYELNEKLPDNIEELNNLDSFTKKNLENLEKPILYKINDARAYELCAYFLRNMEEENINRYYSGEMDGNWEYKQGEVCFSRKIIDIQAEKTIR